MGVHGDAFLVQGVSVGLAEPVKLALSTPAFSAIAFNLRRKCPSGFPFPFESTNSWGWAFRSREYRMQQPVRPPPMGQLDTAPGILRYGP